MWSLWQVPVKWSQLLEWSQPIYSGEFYAFVKYILACYCTLAKTECVTMGTKWLPHENCPLWRQISETHQIIISRLDKNKNPLKDGSGTLKNSRHKQAHGIHHCYISTSLLAPIHDSVKGSIKPAIIGLLCEARMIGSCTTASFMNGSERSPSNCDKSSQCTVLGGISDHTLCVEREVPKARLYRDS